MGFLHCDSNQQVSWHTCKPSEKIFPQSIINQDSNLTLISDNSGRRFYNWLFECHGFWHNVLSCIWCCKLSRAFPRSQMANHMSWYNIVCLCLVSMLNLARCPFQVRSQRRICTLLFLHLSRLLCNEKYEALDSFARNIELY